MDNSDDISALLRDSASGFLSQRHETARMKGAVGAVRRVDRAMWREMAEAGWLVIGLPEALGGLDAGLAPSALLAEMFGRAVLPEPFAGCGVMPAMIFAACEARAVASHAESFARGERLFTLAWQEGHDGLESPHFETRLQNGRVTGAKRFVQAAEDDSVLLVACASGEGLAIVAIEAGGERVTLDRHAAGNGAIAHVEFNDAPILGGVLLMGQAADRALRHALEAGRIIASAELAGLAAGALEKTVAYVSDRVQFGQPIGAFQSVQHRCVDRHIDVLLAGATWREAARAFEAAPDDRSTFAAVSAAKARCGAAALACGKTALQLHGAFGFTEEADIGLYFRAAMCASVWLGTPAAHRQRFLANQRSAAHG